MGWHGYGVPLLADFGEARLGDEHEGLIQPDIYRAPEVILGSRWTAKVDIWNVGVMVDALHLIHSIPMLIETSRSGISLRITISSMAEVPTVSIRMANFSLR